MYRLLLTTLLLGCNPSTDTGKDSTGPVDQDGDGYTGPEDCNSDDATINPAAAEVCDDVDNNCDGNVDEGVAGTFYADADGDGYGDPASSQSSCTVPDGFINDGTDCNDVSGAVNPGAQEVCNFTDDNCNGTVDEGALATFFKDADDDGYGDTDYTYDACVAPDGYTAAGGDCDDGDDTTYPGAEEEDCTDPTDRNCDGSVGYDDGDDDGYAACEDCDDRDAGANPSELEVCDADNTDEDCDGFADDADPSAIGQTKAWTDADGDGHGDPGSSTFACDVPAGSVATDDDCDDGSASAYPGAPEVCNDEDDDCDGAVDDGVLLTVYVDKDGDGYGTDAYSMEACEVPAGYATAGGDCDDHDAAYNPGALEEDCNDPTDYNCDGTVGFTDGDGDGWAACADCDDSDANVNPDEVEVCGGADEDCNGFVDDEDPGVTDPTTVYADTDGDGYGDPDAVSEACEVGTGWVEVAGDCDDSLGTVNPVAYESCDDVDNDCDGTVDDGATDSLTWYLDYDGDEHGGTTATYVGCAPPSGYVATSDDCDDGDPDNWPGNPEVCDGADNNCDGTADDGVAPNWYEDLDLDGFGTEASVLHVCTRPYGYSAVSTDCDDAHDDAFPGATEVCDGYDNDCDALIDDSDSDLDRSTGAVFYPDADTDGYGDASSSAFSCVLPSGWQLTGTDCDDSAADIHPDATDLCNDTDNDCDGEVDEDGWVTVYDDLDLDGDGDRTGEPYMACDGSDTSTTNTDCDDADSTIQACAFYPFDGTTGSAWETVKAPPTTINGFSVYVPTDSPYDMYSFYGSKVYGYDGDTNSWHTFSTTNPLSTYSYQSTAPWNDKFYSIRSGGIRYFDPVADSFTTASSTSMSEAYPMTESDENGTIYGYNNSSYYMVYFDTKTGTTTNYYTGNYVYYTRLAYDPGTRAIFYGTYSDYSFKRWNIDAHSAGTTTSSCPEYLTMAVCSDRAGHIYAAGNSSGTTIYQYTVATDKWAKIPDTPTSIGLTGTCGVSEDGWLYMTAGSGTVYRIALY